jgi:hypothetical protein
MIRPSRKSAKLRNAVYQIAFLALVITLSMVVFLIKSQIILSNTGKCNLWLAFSGLILAGLVIIDELKKLKRLSLLLKILLILSAATIGYLSSQRKDDLNEISVNAQKKKSESLQQSLSKALRDSDKFYNQRLNDSVRVYNKNTNETIVKLSGRLYESFLKTSTDIVSSQKVTIDSLKKQLTKNNYDRPEFFIDTIRTKLLSHNTTRFSFTISNRKAEAREVNFMVYILTDHDSNYLPSNRQYFSTKQLISAKNITYLIDLRSHPDPTDTFYMYFRGEYRDQYNVKYNIDQLYSIDCKKFIVGVPSGFNFDVTMNQMIKAYPELK